MTCGSQKLGQFFIRLIDMMGGGKGGGFGPMMGGGKGGMGGPYGGAPAGGVELNGDGLPLRPGKDQCLLYLNNGSCPNGADCIFDHPASAPKPAEAKGEWTDWNKKDWGNEAAGGGWTDWSKEDGGKGADRPSLEALKGQWEGQKGGGPPVNSGPPPQDMPMQPASTGGGEDGEEPEENRMTKMPNPDEPPELNDDGSPIRPGMQKCGFYMRIGKCTFGGKCRFDHPPGLAGILNMPGGIGTFQMAVGTGQVDTTSGYARRPGKDQCPFLKRTNTCPFGPECRFDHDPSGGPAEGADAPEGAPAVEPEKKKKDSGLGGVRGRRPPRPAAFGRRPQF